MRDSGSELQRKDVKNLLKTKIDFNYLETWVQKLGLSPLYNGITTGSAKQVDKTVSD